MLKRLTAVALCTIALLAPAKAETSFLQAALFFLTDVEATRNDDVSETEINLRQYPLVIYLMEDVPCVVRIRNTRTNILWQMNFCKITRWTWEGPGAWAGYRWIGAGAFCVSRKWNRNENYTDPDFAKIATACDLEQHPYYGTSAYLDRLDIRFYLSGDGWSWQWNWGRSRDRMIASFRYIVWILNGEEPKPY